MNNELETLVEEMVTAGVPDHEIGAFIQEFDGGQSMPVQSQTPTIQNPPAEGSWTQRRPIREGIAGAARTTLEVGGLVGGGAAGGMSVGPVGAVAGGGLGHGIGSNVADRIDEVLGLSESMTLSESTRKAIDDVAEGAMMEMGGQSVTVLAKAIAGPFIQLAKWVNQKLPKLSKEKVIKKASEIYERMGVQNPEALKSVKETKKLLDELDVKTEPTIAQKTGAYGARIQEQALQVRYPEVKTQMQVQDATIRKEALETIEKVFKTGKTNEDIVVGVEKELGRLKGISKETTGQAETQIAKISGDAETQQTGMGIKEALIKEKKAAKINVDAEYKKLPKGIQLDSIPITKAINKTKRSFKLEGGESNTIPKAIIKQMKAASKVTKKNPLGKVTFDNLRDWSSQIKRDIRFSTAGAQPNLNRVRRLMMLKNGVDEAMDQMAKTGNAAITAQYEKATKVFTKYFKTFREKTVGKVLEPGEKVAFSDIPGRFFRKGKMDAADDLIRAVGKDRAKQSIEGFADKNLMSAAYKNGKLNVPQASGWLRNNKEVLNKYGLYDKYNKAIKTQSLADDALVNLNAYEKAVASKVLDADVGKIIKSWIGNKGKVQSAATIRKLMELPGIKGNSSAENGVRTAYKDYLMKEARMNVDHSKDFIEDTFGLLTRQASARRKVINDHLPGMRVLYTPKQIKALQNYNELLNVLGRNKKVVATAGSPTAEKLTGDLSFKEKSILAAARAGVQMKAVGAGKGWYVSAWMRFVDIAAKLPRKISDTQIDSMLIDGAFNPKTAELIMDSVTKYKGSSPAAKKLGQHMMTLGIYSGIRTGNILQEEFKEH